MKLLVIANWKMNPPSVDEAKKLFNSVKRKARKTKNVEVVVCPPFVYLSDLQPRSSKPKLGAQDCFWKEKGPYVGEISPVMLKDLGIKYVILGHSSRRNLFAETDKIINQKIKAALSARLNPIFCIGETEEERNKDQTQRVLKSQIEEGLKKISKKEIQKITIAYEPVWAIGSGKPCDVGEAQKMYLLIKQTMARKYSLLTAERIRIIYGGSVNSKNARPYIKEAHFQGFIIGGASLDSKDFLKIIKSIS